MAQDRDRSKLYGWIATGAMMSMVSAGLVAACNTNPVTFQSSTGAIQGKFETSVSKQTKMDILWVVDNSGSMCQEQKVLRDNFDAFIDVLKDTSLDFHLAVTTTHAPSSDVRFILDPVAQEAHIQATPQPIPGFDSSCIQDASGFQPLRDALSGALDCLADQGMRDQFTWTDAQITCAREGQPAGCGTTLNIPDRNMDNDITLADLFPLPSEYTRFPKVLKSETYREANGSLDVARLKRDFGCMSLVGTRGDGFERGLQVAVKAVSPALTGYSEGLTNADATAPNHGFIRQDAGFTLVFVTDENDCSAPDGAIPATNDCEADICDYYNSTQFEEQSPLFKVEDLAKSFLDNLSKTKGREFLQSELLVASIHGKNARFDKPVPTGQECKDKGSQGRSTELTACNSALGKATSGDRYERFMRQFTNYYPNDASKNDPKNFSLTELGWICVGNFAPALTAIAEFIKGIDPGCITDDVFPCTEDADCPAYLYSEQPGRCTTKPSTDKKFCDSGIVLQITLQDAAGAQFPDIAANPYCLPNSIGKLRTKQPSCIVDPSRFEWSSCAATTGLSFTWKEPTPQVAQQLAGYKLELIYNAAVSDPNAD